MRFCDARITHFQSGFLEAHHKPTGADKYRVIYADLSIKEMTPEDVEKSLEAQAE
jgi:hypothetical protein